MNPLAFASAAERVLTAVDVIRRYLVLLVWPYGLSPDYSFDAVPLIANLFSPQLLLSLATLAVPVVAALWVGRKRPSYLFCCTFFLLSVAIVSNLFSPIRVTMAEGLLYVPSVAICWALARFFLDLNWIPSDRMAAQASGLRRLKLIALLLICIVVPWAGKTYVRNAEWKDDWTLYRAAIRTTPRSVRARLLLGDVYFAQSDYLGAERHYYQALQIYPDFAEAAVRLAAAYRELDRFPKALELLNNFAGRSGTFEEQRLRELGRVYFGLGEFRKAADSYEQALRLNDSDAEAHRELGIIYSQILNQPEKGRFHLERSRALASRSTL